MLVVDTITSPPGGRPADGMEEMTMSTSGFSIDDGATFLVIPRGGNEDDPFDVTAEMGLVVVNGNPDDACVIEGSRAALFDELSAAVKGIESYYVAEHENAYHLRAPESRCPVCGPSEWACVNCDVEGKVRWSAYDASGKRLGDGVTRVRCVACKHVWDPFES